MKLLTFLPLEQIAEMENWEGSKLNDAKEILAMELTTLVHGEEEAEKAKEASKALFSGAGGMENVPTTEMEKSRFEGDGVGLVSLIKELGLVPSNSEGFRTIEQGGLLVNNEKITDKKQQITLDMFEDDALLIKKRQEKVPQSSGKIRIIRKIENLNAETSALRGADVFSLAAITMLMAIALKNDEIKINFNEKWMMAIWINQQDSFY